VAPTFAPLGPTFDPNGTYQIMGGPAQLMSQNPLFSQGLYSGGLAGVGSAAFGGQ